MCGFAGIVAITGEPAKAETLQRMADAMKHRGPDGQGLWTDGSVGLSHRRLAIIDLTEAGHQPMHYMGLTISYNGEIYNYIELKLELEAIGYEFTSQSDTEVLLAAYHCWGEQCVNRFNGMWGFAIHDPVRNIIFLSRDRFGKKPVYMYQDEKIFCFGSEIKAILATGVKPRADYQTIANFLVLSLTETGNETFFEGIRKLGAGCNGIFDLERSQLTTSSYYSIPRQLFCSELDEEATIAKFSECLKKAVQLRLRSDVKVGTSLSGGLDSSWLATLASQQFHQQTDEKFAAVSALSVDKAWDEGDYAKLIVDANHLQWHTTRPTKDDFINSLSDVTLAQEEPFHSTSIFMQYFVMKAAKEAGIKVLLDGQGADELLLGYWGHITPYLSSIPWSKRLSVARQVAHNYGISFAEVIKLYYYFGNSTLRVLRQMNRWNNVKPEYKGSILDKELIRRVANLGKTDLFAFQQLDIGGYTLPMLLRYEDKNSMWFSVETRLPYLDYRLVEMAINTAPGLRIKNGWSKYMLRKSMEGSVPDAITWRRRKFGFAAPEDAWLGDGKVLRPIIDGSVILRRMLHQPEASWPDRASAWRMASVALWEKEFDVIA